MKHSILLILFICLPSIAQSAECIAHRGNNEFYLENSFAAIRSAVEVGSGGVEFDIQHTLDGFPILMHDKTLERTSTHKEGMRCPLDSKIKKTHPFRDFGKL